MCKDQLSSLPLFHSQSRRLPHHQSSYESFTSFLVPSSNNKKLLRYAYHCLLFSFVPGNCVHPFLKMAAKSLRSFHPLNRCLQTATSSIPAKIPRVNMSTIASFKIPKVLNEPNVGLLQQLIGYTLISAAPLCKGFNSTRRPYCRPRTIPTESSLRGTHCGWRQRSELAHHATKHILTLADQNFVHLQATKSRKPFLHDRHILQCHSVRCFGSNRRSTCSKAFVVVASLLRPSCNFPQGRGSDCRKIQI